MSFVELVKIAVKKDSCHSLGATRQTIDLWLHDQILFRPSPERNQTVKPIHSDFSGKIISKRRASKVSHCVKNIQNRGVA